MPKWPAWVLFGVMAACAYPAVTASAPRTEVQAPVQRQAAAAPADGIGPASVAPLPR